MEHIFVGCGRPVILFSFFSWKTIYSFGWCKIHRVPTTVSCSQRASHMTHLGHSGARASPKSPSTPSQPRLSLPSREAAYFFTTRSTEGSITSQIFFSWRKLLFDAVHSSIHKHSNPSDLLASEPWQQHSFVQKSSIRRQNLCFRPSSTMALLRCVWQIAQASRVSVSSSVTWKGCAECTLKHH